MYEINDVRVCLCVYMRMLCVRLCMRVYQFLYVPNDFCCSKGFSNSLLLVGDFP